MSLSTTNSNRRSEASARIRDELIDAAIVEFSSHGFTGASTRAIANRAGAHQPQINYHFDSKESLWRAALERLLSEVDELLVPPDGASPREVMETVIRGIVTFSARRPELNRIMIHEGTNPSDRLAWLVETHVRPRAEGMLATWQQLVDAGEAAPVPANLVYHLLIGASSLLHANAPEARLLFDFDPSDPEIVDAHADALIDLFLNPKEN